MTLRHKVIWAKHLPDATVKETTPAVDPVTARELHRKRVEATFEEAIVDGDLAAAEAFLQKKAVEGTMVIGQVLRLDGLTLSTVVPGTRQSTQSPD